MKLMKLYMKSNDIDEVGKIEDKIETPATSAKTEKKGKENESIAWKFEPQRLSNPLGPRYTPIRCITRFTADLWESLVYKFYVFTFPTR